VTSAAVSVSRQRTSYLLPPCGVAVRPTHSTDVQRRRRLRAYRLPTIVFEVPIADICASTRVIIHHRSRAGERDCEALGNHLAVVPLPASHRDRRAPCSLPDLMRLQPGSGVDSHRQQMRACTPPEIAPTPADLFGRRWTGVDPLRTFATSAFRPRGAYPIHSACRTAFGELGLSTSFSSNRPLKKARRFGGAVIH